jgi:Flp pilus assembly protein TadG
MAMKTLIDRLCRTVRNFRAANGANVTITFALATIPMVGFVGAAVDYSHANSVKTALQAAADSTALMLSKTASTMSSSQLQTQANSYFTALFTRPEATGLVVNANYNTTNGSQVLVTATANVKANFMGLMGISSMKVAADSQVKWGNTKMRVALVLDNTGSMSDDGKMPALITATNSLLTQLKNAATNNGDVYVSIIPFVKDVNMGASNYNANWIDWTDWESPPDILGTWIPNNQDNWDQTGPGDDCPFTNNSHGFYCAPNPTSSSTTSSVPSSGTYKGYICPSNDTGKKNSALAGLAYNGCYTSVSTTQQVSSGWSASCGSYSNCSCSGSGSTKKCTRTYYKHDWVVNNHNTWNGCVVDRGNSTAPSSGNYDQNATLPTTTNSATQYAAEQYGSCPAAAVMQLNYNWSTMTSLVNSMSPNGNTNQGIGLQIGWQSLVGGGPFTVPAKDPNYKYTDVIILMTDGLNTQNRWYTSQTSIDTRQATTCTNVKAAGVVLYTVQVNTGGDPTSTLLKNCATDSSKFFLLTSANQMVSAFTQIGTALSNLRIAQ